MYKLQEGEFWCWMKPNTVRYRENTKYENTPLIGKRVGSDGYGDITDVHLLLPDGRKSQRALTVYNDMVIPMCDFMMLCLVKSDRLEVRDGLDA